MTQISQLRALPIVTIREEYAKVQEASAAYHRAALSGAISTDRLRREYQEASKRWDEFLNAEILDMPSEYRQSNIARFDACPLSLLLDVMRPESQSGNMAARGTLFHRWVGKALLQMRAEGWTEYPVEMGLERLLQVLSQTRDEEPEIVVHLPMSELRWLRVLVTKWCQGTMYGGGFNAQRIIALEERLNMSVLVPDGRGGMYARVVTGQPDVLLADPPDGIIVVDWKTGWAKPSKTEEAALRNSDEDGTDRLSDQGYAQQVIYGALGLNEYPATTRFTLREAYVMWGEFRESTIYRHELERILDVLGIILAQMDAAFAEGAESDRWIAKAGIHCGICPAPRECPIKEWEGIPTTLDEAVLLAREWIVAAQVRKDRAPLLKGWVDANGPLEIDHGKGRRVIGWPEWDGQTKARGTFKIYEPVDAPESPFDVRMEAAVRP